MEILGYFGAAIMGLTLGLIGGGGSILTVPILVYLFHINPVPATAYSLFIVGITSLIGAFGHIRMGNIHWKTAIVFGIPSIISVYFTRWAIVPAIPQEIFSLGGFVVTKPLLLLLLFAALMVAASVTMIRKPKSRAAPGELRFNYPLILAEGLAVGVVTGLVGAGGGFLIIPALVLLANLPMKQAVGTSLIIIAAKSLIGFTGDVNTEIAVDWPFLLLFSAIATAGILGGSLLSKHLDDAKLKPAFGWFVLVMGVYIIAKELFF